MPNYADRVAETTGTSGTGALALGGAAVGGRAFADAFTSGDEVTYTVENAAKTQWETGTGTYTTGSISRDTVSASSNGGALVSFDGGTKTVFATAGAALLNSVQTLVSAAWKRPLKPRSKAARIFAGRTGSFTTNASGTTFATTMAAPRRFDAFQVVLHNAGSAAIQIDACTVAMCSGTTTDSLLMGGGQTIVTVTFDAGSATSTIPLAATNHRSYKISDIIDAANVEAVDRGDGGATYLINARHYTAQAAASISVIGNGSSDNYTNWRTASNERIWLSRQMNGNQTATAGASWSTTDISQTTIAGFIFYCEGQVVSIGAVGDSVAFGFGSTRKGAGVMEYIADYFNSLTGVATSTINIARSGATTDEYKYGVADLIAAGIVPDVMLMSGGTINDLSTTLAAGNVRKWRRWLSIQMAQCWDAGCVPVPMTVVASTGKAMDSTDSLRVAHNTDLLTWRGRGQPVIDFAGAIGGSDSDADGQIEPDVALAPDGTHPNDAGNAAGGALGVIELAALFA